jgi:choline dehydrogenase
VDLVIVGAGAAGAVIASRVSEKQGRDVWLLEAGPDYPDLLPPDLQDGTRNSMTRHDWGYWHRPNPRTFPFFFPRGKVVGGSTAVNTCIALRGQSNDYDEWADLGLPEWSYAKCRPAFLRLERDLDFPDSDEHGHDGPIPIRRHTEEELVPWQRAFRDTALALGHPPCADHNGPRPIGVGPQPMNKIDGKRMGVAQGYLGPAVRARDGFHLRPDTLVRRVLFDRADKYRVRAVEVERHGVVHVWPAKTVVLAGGAIGTLGILLRSGIGPRDDVARIGVELVAHVPAVGKYLRDHPGVGLFLRPLRDDLGLPAHPLIQVMLRTTSKGSDFPGDLHFQAGSQVPIPGAPRLVSLMAHVGKTAGTGRIVFESARVHARPKIRSHFLDHPLDRARAHEAIFLLRSIARELSSWVKPFWPSRAKTDDDDALKAFANARNDSGYHPCGTVPMGPDTSDDAAVDGHGRVRGVEGLYVADASLMPTIPAVNINIPTIMIGERFGEWFRDGVLA